MNEINQRWQRDNRLLRRSTGYGIVLGMVLWPISYYTSLFSASQGQGQWFTAVSVVTLVAAIVVSIGTAISAGIIIADEPPLDGSNRY